MCFIYLPLLRSVFYLMIFIFLVFCVSLTIFVQYCISYLEFRLIIYLYFF